MKIAPFDPVHYYSLVNEGLTEDPKFDFRQVLRASKFPSQAVVNDAGQVLMIGGVIPIYPRSGEAWAIFNEHLGPHQFLQITRLVRGWFKKQPFDRIAATVECNFTNGIRWLSVLGFSIEAPRMAQYRYGQDYALFSLIQKGE